MLPPPPKAPVVAQLSARGGQAEASNLTFLANTAMLALRTKSNRKWSVCIILMARTLNDRFAP